MADAGHDGVGQHDQRDMPMPAVPGATFVVVEAEFGLGGLEAFLHSPARAFHSHQGLDGGACGAPGREVGVLAIGKAAADQQAAGPGARRWRVVLGGIQIGEWAIYPIVKPLALGAVAGRQALPGLGRKRPRNVLCLAGDPPVRVPGAKQWLPFTPST